MNKKDVATKKRPSLLARLLSFLITLGLVLGAVLLVANYDKLNFDTIKRYFNYHTLEKNENGETGEFSYNSGGAFTYFAALSGDLLVCSDSGIRLYSSGGNIYIDRQPLKNPVLTSTGTTAVIYDAGGTDLFVIRNREVVFSPTLEESNSIIAASVSKTGYLALVHQAGGYKSALTVYGADGNKVMQLSLSTRFIMDAVVSPDGKQVAVLTMGLENNVVDSTISLYPLDGKSGEAPQVDGQFSLGNTTVLSLRWDSSGIWTLREDQLTLTDTAGETLAEYSYSGQYLKEFTMDGTGFSALLLGKYRAGTTATLLLLNSKGEAATLPVNEQILSLSAAGRYIAVLTADRLDIYTQDLTLISTLEGTQSARQVLMQEDGSVLLISSKTARIYLPD